jgi:hypothetical protein
MRTSASPWTEAVTMASDALLTVDDVRVHYGKVEALKGV